MMALARRWKPAVLLGGGSGAVGAQLSGSAAASTPAPLPLACIQLQVTADKAANLEHARRKVAEAASNGARLIMLPEIFNSPYSNDSFPVYAEPLPPGTPLADNQSPSASMLSAAAKEHGIYLVGGSIPEREGEQLYNTTMVFDPSGELVAKHRKTHLFDIDIPGKMTFRESDTLTGGTSLTMFTLDGIKIGLGICYDMRFAEMANIACAEGARVMLYPAAFNTTTGPPHWELLQKARALDNFLYVATASPARNPGGEGYQAWGHSTVVGPWGDVLATTEHEEAIVYATLDFARQDEIRAQIPILQQKRNDLFSSPSRL